MYLALLISVCLLLALLWAWRVRQRQQRRQARLSWNPPDHWDAACRRHIRWYPRLPPADRRRLLQLAAVFIDEKRFEACGGLEQVTEDMQVVIAALACALVLHRPPPHYPRLRSILVYPSGFEVPPDPGGFVRADPYQTTDPIDAEAGELVGESWLHGSVVLAWDNIVHPPDPAERELGVDNVALHEFAHQLDEDSAAGEGVPLLDRRQDYAEWGRVFSEAFKRLEARVNRGASTALDPYAATSPGEFFAVATEAFFERPEPLRRAYPEVYRQLAKFYGVDLAAPDAGASGDAP